MRTLTKDKIKHIVTLYKNEEPVLSICAKCHISLKTLYRIVEKECKHRANRVLIDVREKMAKDYKKGMSIKEIVCKYDSYPAYVYSTLANMGVRRKSRQKSCGNDVRSKVIAIYKKNQSIQMTSKLCHLSAMSVRKYLREAGIDIPKKQKISQKDCYKIIDLYEKDGHVSDIAYKMKLSRTSIYNVLSKYNIPIRQKKCKINLAHRI